MMIKNFILILLLMLVQSSFAQVKTVHPQLETDTLKWGDKTADDPAIWLHPKSAEKSLILGTNKNQMDEGGHGGLAVYNMQGKEIDYFEVGALNNVDIIYNVRTCPVCPLVDIAIGSNRDNFALSVFKIEKDGDVEHLKDIKISANGQAMEPYGLCTAKSFETGKIYTFIPQKDGHAYQYEMDFSFNGIKAKMVRDINLANKITAEQDSKLRERIWKELVYEGEEGEFEDELKSRFQLEGCVADEEYGLVYIGMENVGIFKTALWSSFDYNSHLIAEVTRSKVEIETNPFPEGAPRIAADVEGLSLYRMANGGGYLVASIQGINEYALFDRYNHQYYGSFQIMGNGQFDDVTETDGLDLLSTPMGKEFPNGILVVHDDEKEGALKGPAKANYKIISMKDVISQFPHLIQTPSTYNPRERR